MKAILTINQPAREARFCLVCGNRLIQKQWEGRIRPFCSHCARPIYENPVPASAIVVADKKSNLLLVKRKVKPKRGYWSLAGGFMELSETPEEAALRELKEETGVSGTIRALLGVKASQSDLYGTVLVVGYLVTAYRGKITAGDDVKDVAFFSPDKLPEIAFNSHQIFIQTALKYLSG